MRRRGLELLTLLVAVVIGYGWAVVLTPGVVAPAADPQPGQITPVTTSTTSPPVVTVTTTPPAGDGSETFLVWSTGGLTSQLTEALQARFDDLSIVAGDAVEMSTGDDWVVPLDAVAVDDDHRAFDPTGSLGPLRPGTIALGASSARFRGAAIGDELIIGGTVYEVVAIVPDEVVGAAEVVFTKSDPSSPVVTDRFALVTSGLARNEFEQVVRDMYEGPAPLRIRTGDETPWLRHGDAVLPQIFIKTALGEFAYNHRSGSEFTQDPEFVSSRIVEEEVPILGTVTCHVEVVAMLEAALSRLVDEGLSHLVEPAGFAGCWNPRYINPATGISAGISRHAWGAAVDLNAPANPLGSAGNQDPRLVASMIEAGFTWGGDWLVPDPMHFEYGIAP